MSSLSSHCPLHLLTTLRHHHAFRVRCAPIPDATTAKDDVCHSYNTSTLDCYGCKGISSSRCSGFHYRITGPFTDRDEILHPLRGLKEKEHQEKVCTLVARSPLYCKFPASQDSVEWDLDPRCYGLGYFIDCHNKPVAIYLFYPDIREPPGLVRDQFLPDFFVCEGSAASSTLCDLVLHAGA